ncbi:ankyrin repeat domain-containing protein [Desulfovibrio litoralis]|uniref:Ankyrin repeat n=1 Tax=Desulfovibrio litoralis DSM 11393 TaxID=1121455 RepID=A0A1M7TBQ1_9BACT|nr:ankyrin repeat domain-containing protein [Desulfovibrio litoralis]SHN68097.1 Ankyrin repeat [Desulfovibrio litoralis DSM 11393]
MRILSLGILFVLLFSNNAFAFKGEAAEAILYEAVYNQMERERMEQAGVKKLHPEGFYKICASGTLDEVKKAIAEGADPKIPDADRGQTTCLHDAATFNKDERVIALLIKEGVNINAQGNLNKRTALHLAILVNPNAAAIIKELAKGKPDYYLTDTKELNPFVVAISGAVDQETGSYYVPDEAVLLALLDANPDYAKQYAKISDKYNLIELYFSRFDGGTLNPNKIKPSAKVVERLIKGGNNINITVRKMGSTEPLLFAAIDFDSQGKYQGETPTDTLTNLFLKNGADIYATDDTGELAIHKAAFNGNAKVIKALLALDKKKELAKVQDEFGNTPLHDLTEWRSVELPTCGKLLIDAGADINARDKDGNTPFLMIAKSSDIPRTRFEADDDYKKGVTERQKAVKFLLANGADIKATDNKGRNPLHSLSNARVLSKPDLELFIKAGVDINARDKDGNTPLMLFVIASRDRSDYYDEQQIAMFTKNLPILKELGADPKIQNKDGKIPYDFLHKNFLDKAKDEIAFLKVAGKDEPTLFNVCEKGCDEKTIKEALAKGMDIDVVRSGVTPLHMAIASKDEKTVKALLACGAPIDKASDKGETPLGVAFKMDQYDIASTLIKAGANLNKEGFMVTDSNKKKFITSYVIGAVLYNDTKMFELLMQGKPDLEFKSHIWSDSRGNKAWTGSYDEGWDVWATNGTPLHAAIVTNNLAFAERLIQNGADPNATLDRGLSTPLHLAALQNNKALVELLFKHGAKIYSNNFDKTPYDYATNKDIKALLKNIASK